MKKYVESYFMLTWKGGNHIMPRHVTTLRAAKSWVKFCSTQKRKDYSFFARCNYPLRIVKVIMQRSEKQMGLITKIEMEKNAQKKQADKRHN